MSGVITKLEEITGRGRVRQNEQVEQHTILKKGGYAEYYIEVDKTGDFIKIIQKAIELGVPIFVFGSGSKISIPVEGIKGLVIKNNCRRFEKAGIRGIKKDSQIEIESVMVYAEAGAIINQVVRFVIEEGLEGLEYQLGLPGTVGGAIYSNAKYNPKNIYARSHLFSIKILNGNGEVQAYSKELPHFVSFEEDLYDMKEFILSATFKLNPFDKNELWKRGKEAVEFRNNWNKSKNL